MRNLVIVLFFGVLMFQSCENEINPLCNCIEKSEALNQLSSKILGMEEVSVDLQKELFALRAEIDSVCAPFRMMGPEELYKMRNECIESELLKLNHE
jgi:hypothetical protein